MRYKETPYGFDYGAASVTRAISEPKKGSDGWVLIDVTTPRDAISVYVTRTGKIRIYSVAGGLEWQRPKENK